MINKEVNIKASLFKILFNILGAIAFVIIGLSFIIFGYKDNVVFDIIMKILGVLSVVFFGFICIFLITKTLSRKIGFSIKEEGIYDYSSYIGVGFIPWEEITSIKEHSMKKLNKRFIMIYVKNPEKYIENSKNNSQKKFLIYNYKIYKTPIVISDSLLRVKHEELFEMLEDFFTKKNS